MKLRYYLLSILAGAALATGCAQEQVISSLAEFKPELSCIGLPYEGGISSMNFTCTADWSVEQESVPEWLTVTPTSGVPGSSVLVFATDPNPGATARTADVLVNVGGRQQRLIVTQAGAGPIEAPISTVQQLLDGSDGEVFRIKGTVTSIASTYYGNLYVKDATGTIYMYGINNEMGQDPRSAEGGWDSFGIEVGDVITVQGPRSTHNGTVELYYATLIEVEKAQILMDESSFEVGSDAGTLDIYAVVKAKGVLVQPVDPWIRVTGIRAGEKDEVIYSVEYDANTTSKKRTGIIEFRAPGYVMEASITQEGLPPTGMGVSDIIALDDATLVESLPSVVVAKTGSGFVISDGAAVIYAYDKEKKFVGDVAIGDNVKVFGSKTTYNGVPEIEALTAVEKDGTASVDYPAPKDVTADVLSYTARTAEYIQLTGTLKVSGNYFNIEIGGVDPTVKQGSIASPAEALNAASYNGKTITVTGYFNGFSSAGKYLNIIAVKIVEAGAKGTLNNPYSPTDAIEAVKDLAWASNSDYEVTDPVYMKGKISRIAQNKGVDQVFTAEYGNASFYISADGSENGEFYIFRTLYLGNRKWVEGDTQIKVGDEVIVYGPLMNYQSNTPETVGNKSYLYSLNGKTE